MSIERSDEFILAALFLARCGPRDPPPQLGTYSWANAYAAFYDALAEGRSLRSFHNSLKASRDQFDSHVESTRRGWRDGDAPKPLPQRDADVLESWSRRSDAELWEAVRVFVDPRVADVPEQVIADLSSEWRDDEERVFLGREGREKAVVSSVRERSPGLRSAALRLHGTSCQVCGFDFGATYGSWGEGFAEVHHVRALASAPAEGVEVDPATDLAVVCSNCHRMIHRKAKRVLSLEELRDIVSSARQENDV